MPWWRGAPFHCLRAPSSRSQLLSCLAQICKYSQQLASQVLTIPKSIFLPARHLSVQQPRLRRAAANLVYQQVTIAALPARHHSRWTRVAQSHSRPCPGSPQVKNEGRQCYELVESGDIAGLVRFIQLERHTPREATSAILALGHVANVASTLARAVGDSGAVEELLGYSETSADEEVLAAIGWMTTRVAHHGRECARPLAMKGVLGSLLATHAKVEHGRQAQANTMEALVVICENCESHTALEALVHVDTPPEALDVVLRELCQALHDSGEGCGTPIAQGCGGRDDARRECHSRRAPSQWTRGDRS